MKESVGRQFILAGSFLVLAAVIGAIFTPTAHAQPTPVGPAPGPAPALGSLQQASGQSLPDAPGAELLGSIYGTVTDPNGNVIEGAQVILTDETRRTEQTQTSDGTGFFRFSGLAAGIFRVRVIANGFAKWTGPETALSAGRYLDLPEIVLQVASAQTDVEVVVPTYEIAEEQIQAQEQQRLLGVFPNFYTSYIWQAAPLTSGQKFRLAARSMIDPVTFVADAATAGIEQSQGYAGGYGGGGEGYAKRFGATYANDAIGTFLGSAVLPSVLHQDPRYFYKGTGSIASRAVYAISTVVICRGDDGKRQPNYSNVLGNLAAAGISNLYFPASDRDGAGATISNALIGTAEGALTALLQEFVFKKISHGVRQQSPPAPQAAARPD